MASGSTDRKHRRTKGSFSAVEVTRALVASRLLALVGVFRDRRFLFLSRPSEQKHGSEDRAVVGVERG